METDQLTFKQAPVGGVMEPVPSEEKDRFILDFFEPYTPTEEDYEETLNQTF